MKNRRYLLLIIGLLITNSIIAQKTIELGLFVGGTNSIITPSFNEDVELNYDHHISYAILGSYFITEKSYITSGLRYQPLGATSQTPVTSVEKPEGTGEYKTTHWNAFTIGGPIKWGYRFYSNKRMDISSEIGLITSYVIKQDLTTDISEQELNIYNDFIISGSASLCLGIKLNKNYNLIFKPNFQYQLNELNTEAFFVTNKKSKLFYYGLEFGISRKI